MRRKNNNNVDQHYLDVKMSRKFTLDNNKKIMYEFTVILIQDDKKEYKVSKSYPEFVELEAYINDIINHYSKKGSQKFPLLSKS